MDRKTAEEVVINNIGTIYGFARSKEWDVDKIEEIAARIAFEVYVSLLRVESIQSIRSYIYKISCNVYSKFVDEEKKHELLLQNHQKQHKEDKNYDFYGLEKDYSRLRKEISYLGKIHREIITMYYFSKMGILDIAQKLNLSVGYIKKHLFDAREQLREGMTMQDIDINQAVAIKFKGVGQYGTDGVNGENIDTYFNKLIAQNIAYAAYYEAKTITEIARELCIPAIYIENELQTLVEFGYIDRVSGNKYLTNMMIIENSNRILEEKHEIYTKYAKIVCEKYVPKLFKVMEKFDPKTIYTPKNDLNFLMWSIVSYATKFKLTLHDKSSFLNKHKITRKDGSENIAFAWIDESLKWQELSYVKRLYDVLEDINSYNQNEKRHWQFNTYYDDRKTDWHDYSGLDYGFLYDHLTGKIVKTIEHADKYKRLYDKCFLVRVKDTDYINMILVKPSEKVLLDMLPEMTVRLKSISKKLDEEIFNVDKTQFPSHIHDLCRSWNTDVLASTEIRTRVLEQLLKKGMLEELTEAQKMTVNIVMFSDILPE
ncbi:MAG: hypothetical protein FWG98_04470 [Candidatus Cloacimonetes bacterium]|nr:hypothetical protein [Candidatus Cloacimonadota bacterium]